MSTPEKRIQELHLTLPPAPKPVAVYKTAVKFGTLLFVSGHGPLKPDKTQITGRVGKAIDHRLIDAKPRTVMRRSALKGADVVNT